MGYHDGSFDIPNYWAYAKNFVLQDHLFEPNASWSLPAHLFMMSEWSARCNQPGNPMKLCKCAPYSLADPPRLWRGAATSRLRLDRPHLSARTAPGVSWRYYISTGQPARLREWRRCTATPVVQSARNPAGDLEPAALLRHGQTGRPAC